MNKDEDGREWEGRRKGGAGEREEEDENYLPSCKYMLPEH